MNEHDLAIELAGEVRGKMEYFDSIDITVDENLNCTLVTNLLNDELVDEDFAIVRLTNAPVIEVTKLPPDCDELDAAMNEYYDNKTK